MRPLDKQNNPPSKPLTPSMSAAFNRKTKSPLTPKLAGYNSPHLNRKPHLDAPITHISRSSENASPAPSTLNANITPRSGPRNTRRDGVSSSPSGGSPQAPHSSRLPQPAGGYPTEPALTPRDTNGVASRPSRPKSLVNGGPHSASISRPVSSCNSALGSSMFFHADDARSSVSSHDSDNKQHHIVQTNTRRFLYANGIIEQPHGPSDISPKAGLTIGKRQNAGHSATPVRSPVVSPRLQNALPLLSPSKEPTIPTSRDPNRTSLQSVHPQEQVILQTLRLSPPSPDERRQYSHIKSPSVDGSQCFRQTRPPLMSSPSHPVLLASAQNHASSPSQTPLPSSNRSSASGDTLPSFPRIGSPAKEDSNNNLQKLNDLAANARTERKVLDLEISNSSLLAINRALEREMRKQNTELRRYRRLSRTGRLSIVSSRRSVSGSALSMVSETDDVMSAKSAHSLSDIQSDSEDDDLSSDEETSGLNDGTDNDGHHRPRDEKYLFDDLAKHQQLLIDGQKLNQSITRCLGWTESLIVEGKKALEFQVHISDIEIGGRVLASDDSYEEWEGGRGLLSPSTQIPRFPEEHCITDEAILANMDLSHGDDDDGEHSRARTPENG